ncbi:MAG: hypothetical protein JW875_00455 [Spirochaetales bacterium]|nr:hypothetical protein [Spirochaetales bacterium]
MRANVLSVDIGTSSLKAAIITVDGYDEGIVRVRFPRSGARTTKDWIQAFTEALELLKIGRQDVEELRAIVVSGNGPTLVGINDKGEAGPVLMWNDPLDFEAAHKARETGPSLFIPRIIEYRGRYPEFASEGCRILSAPEFLLWKLTGNPVTILPTPRYESTYWTAASLSEANIDCGLLPSFVHSGQKVGQWKPPHYAHPITAIAGGPDFFVALAGTGAILPGLACDRAGSSEGLNICLANRVSHPDIRVLPSVQEPYWNASYLLPETGFLFNTWRLLSGQSDQSYPQLLQEIVHSPIIPPEGEAPHQGRQLVEGIAFSVRTAALTLKEATGFKGEWRLSGGQAKNAIWNQLKADITGETFVLTEMTDGELMGNAVIAFHSMGRYKTLALAAKKMIRVVNRYTPNRNLHNIYKEKYNRFMEKPSL